MECTGYITGRIKTLSYRSGYSGDSVKISVICSYRVKDDSRDVYRMKSMLLSMSAFGDVADSISKIGRKRVALVVGFDFKPYRIDGTDIIGTYANAVVLDVEELLPTKSQPIGLRYDKNEIWVSGTVMRKPKTIIKPHGSTEITALSFPLITERPMKDSMSTKYQMAPMIIDCVYFPNDSDASEYESIKSMSYITGVGHLQTPLISSYDSTGKNITHRHPIVVIDFFDIGQLTKTRWMSSVMKNDVN